MDRRNVMNMLQFTVRKVVVDEVAELNTYAVCLYEERDGTGQRVELQRALSFDEQDAEMGMDTYCVSIPSGATHYGGVLAYALNVEALEISLDEEAQAELDVEGGFSLLLDVPETDVFKLKTGLARIFVEA